MKTLDYLLNEHEVFANYAPVEFAREISTTEACELFECLYRRSYFRMRHRKSMTGYYKHANLPQIAASDELVDYYAGVNGERNVNRLRECLAGVDRRIFYRCVADLIAGDGCVFDVELWVAQNMATAERPEYVKGDDSESVIDGLELIFIGYGLCGQTNRLLGFLLKYGLSVHVNFVSTDGHAFVEVGLDGQKVILDSDFFKCDQIGQVNVNDLVENQEDAIKKININLKSLCCEFIPDFEPGLAYISTERGEAYYYYNDLALTADGTKIYETVCTTTIKQKTIPYASPGRPIWG